MGLKIYLYLLRPFKKIQPTYISRQVTKDWHQKLCQKYYYHGNHGNNFHIWHYVSTFYFAVHVKVVVSENSLLLQWVLFMCLLCFYTKDISIALFTSSNFVK